MFKKGVIKINKTISIIALLATILLVIFIVQKYNSKDIIMNESVVNIEDSNTMPIDSLYNEIKIIRPIAKDIKTGESKITFSGMADPALIAKLNGNKINTYYTGNFITEVPLEIGENNFEFSLGDKKLNYKVTREFKIIDSIIPKDILQVDSDTEVTISAKLYSGSSAYAEINGEKIELEQVESNEYIGARDTTYANFKGTYIPKGNNYDTDLGNINIYASFDNKTEVKKGGKVVVNKLVARDRSNLNRSVIINRDSAKVYNSNNISVTPMAEYSPLAKGTYDYVLSEIKVDNRKYYNLLSNKRVKAEDVQIVDKLDINESSIDKVSFYDEGEKTCIRINRSEKAPYNIMVRDISFKDRNKENYTVEEYDPEYIYLYFNYIEEINKIDFKKNKLFKEAKFEEENGEKYLKIKLKNKGGYSGHFATYDSDGNLVIEFRNKKSSINDMKIVIDPGHGLTDKGIDSGALGWNDINEHYINMEISKYLAKALKDKGAEVILLDTDNELINLSDRGAKSKEYDSDLYISIHNNSGGSGKINATETYYFTPFSMIYAKEINKSLVNTYSNKLFPKDNGEYDRGAKYNDYTVTLERENPSVLVEAGYVDNPVSFSKLIDPKCQKDIANGIARGVENSIK